MNSQELIKNNSPKRSTHFLLPLLFKTQNATTKLKTEILTIKFHDSTQGDNPVRKAV